MPQKGTQPLRQLKHPWLPKDAGSNSVQGPAARGTVPVNFVFKEWAKG